MSEVKENEMKRIMVVLMALSMVSIANAKPWLSVNDQVDPPPITLSQNQTAKISIWCGGTYVVPGELPDSAAPLFLTISGPGSLDIDNATNLVNPDILWIWEGEPADGAVFIDITVPYEPFWFSGTTVADNIFMRCDGLGDVTLSLYHDETPLGGQFLLVDTQVFHQIPEPVTVALLGLGGLLLRRRIA